MKLYVNPDNGIYYANFDGVWKFWSHDAWVVSEDAKPSNDWYKSWKLELVGNNFRLK